MDGKFFCGKRVLVTGAAQGIGYGISEKLAESGAVIIALDLSLEILQPLKSRFPEAILPVALDLTNWEATSKALQALSPIDFLVNNAGVAVIEPLETITEAQYDKTFNVNVKGAINVTKLVIADLLARNSPGAVVILSSQASQAGLLNHSLYCASKGAIDAFCRAAALELGPKNIRINTVNPTVVMTELGRKIWSDPKMGDPMLAKIPLKRFAEVGDVVEAVIFLLSDRARMITGSSLAVDGGFLASTIDLNFAELEYLADHLLPAECRRLVAAAHFKSYMQPKTLGQAENAIPKDVPCIQLLLHWNSAEGEGKGETHEVLEHRLRQMGKIELADWLGRTVFKQLGQDLEESLNEGLGDLANDSTTRKIDLRMPTLSPPVIYTDPKEWLPFDTICLALLCVLFASIVAILCFALWRGLRGRFRKTTRAKRVQNEQYEMLMEYSSNSESDDDKFDIREHESRL